jgi:hypothetical protein
MTRAAISVRVVRPASLLLIYVRVAFNRVNRVTKLDPRLQLLLVPALALAHLHILELTKLYHYLITPIMK